MEALINQNGNDRLRKGNLPRPPAAFTPWKVANYHMLGNYSQSPLVFPIKNAEAKSKLRKDHG